jgi:hypothetical protein
MDLELNGSPDIAPNELHSESTGLSDISPSLVPHRFAEAEFSGGLIAQATLLLGFPKLPLPAISLEQLTFLLTISLDGVTSYRIKSFDSHFWTSNSNRKRKMGHTMLQPIKSLVLAPSS